MVSFARFTDIDLDKQIESLSEELAALKAAVRKQRGALRRDGRDMARELYSDIAELAHETLPVVRKQGRAIERGARDHPMVAAAGVAALGLLAVLLLSRRA